MWLCPSWGDLLLRESYRILYYYINRKCAKLCTCLGNIFRFNCYKGNIIYLFRPTFVYIECCWWFYWCYYCKARWWKWWNSWRTGRLTSYRFFECLKGNGGCHNLRPASNPLSPVNIAYTSSHDDFSLNWLFMANSRMWPPPISDIICLSGSDSCW